MNVKNITLNNFRNINNCTLSFDKNVNIIIGENAQGKTNLLEAIYLMTGTRSFRGSRDRDLPKFDENFCNVSINFEDLRRTQKIEMNIGLNTNYHRKYKVNNVNMIKLSEIFDYFKCIAFTPDDINLIKGTPDCRRKFVDMCISQLKPNYINFLTRFNIASSQKNAVLKNIAMGVQKANEIDIWNSEIAKYGSVVAQQRFFYSQNLNKICNKIYEKIAGNNEQLQITYNSNVISNDILKNNINNNEYIKKVYLEKLQSCKKEDIEKGRSYIGSNRDDFQITINGKKAGEFASQGQKKSIAIVLKLSQARIFENISGEMPVILLDDVMAELDRRRQTVIFDIINKMQVFITTPHIESIESKGTIYSVKNGDISKL